MKYISGLAISAGIAMTGAAFAQSHPSSLGGGYYYDGFIEFSYFDDGFSTETLSIVDIDAGISPNAGLSGFPVGFTLGIDAVSFGGGGTDLAVFYPAVTFGLGGNGMVSLGAPRSVLDMGYIPQNTFAGVSYVELETSFFLGPFVPSVALFGERQPYGARYDGEFGDLKFGASYNRFDDVGFQVDVYGLAFSYALQSVGSVPELVFFGGVEFVDGLASSGPGYTLGAEAKSGRFNTSILFRDLSPAVGNLQSTELSGSYEISNSLTASASALLLSGDITDELYGLGIRYQMPSGVYVDAGVVDGGLFGGTIYEASVGWRF